MAMIAILTATPSWGADLVKRADSRFQSQETDEAPDFRRHVVPLMGKLACNSRSCHGSFQGRGGFRLSLFGYDFKMDHDGLAAGDEPRIDLENPTKSLALLKPTEGEPHEGGKRMDVNSWEYNLFHAWIQKGGKQIKPEDPSFVRLDVSPSEILFNKDGQTSQLTVIAVWSDGSRENVTCLSRFKTNDDQVALIDGEGLVSASKPGDTHVVVFYDNGVQPISVIRPLSALAGENYPKVDTPTQIDKLVVNKLRKLGIVPSDQSSDAEFLRRVSLDLTGTLPTPDQVETFLADSNANKRAEIIETLMESPAYVAWWTTKICDFTGNNSDALANVTPVRGQSSQDWYDWVAKRVTENAPYDDLVEGIVMATGREQGQTYTEYSETMSKLYAKKSEGNFAERHTMPYYWARRTVRRPEEKALAFAYTFMGIRIQCAQCHKHPFDQWTQDDYKQFTNFFRRVNSGVDRRSRDEQQALLAKLDTKDLRGGQLRRRLGQLVRDGAVVPFDEVYVTPPSKRPVAKNNKNKKKNRRRTPQTPASAKVLGGEIVNLNELEDPRSALMEWLREKDNPYFARSFVNRVWANYFNIGIVEPPDDLSLANPPSNRELLDYLTSAFVENDYDMKWLHRTITNSRAYQASWKPNETNRADQRNFSHSIARRLPAEIAYDAIRQATAADKSLAALHTDLKSRTIAIAGASARGNRGNGPAYALTIFGKSIRESNCDCDRSSEPSLLQTLYLQNDRDLLSMIDRPRDGWIDELARSLKPAGNKGRQSKAVRQAAAKISQINKLFAGLQARKKKLVKEDNIEQVKELDKKIKRLKSQRNKQVAIVKKSRKEAEEAQPQKVASLDTASIVKQAYLRSLSRYPSESELKLSSQYIDEADDTVEGVRGLLWALLNTKEFIVNH